MVIRLRNATIKAIEDTETKRLKLLRIVSKAEGAKLTLELPEALCDKMNVRDGIVVIVDSKPIARGNKSKLYAEGDIFKIGEGGDFEVVGAIGGLRFVLTLVNPTPAKKKVFAGDRFYLALL
jgi:hypothetical protein